MQRRPVAIATLTLLALAGCKDKKPTAIPEEPASLTPSSATVTAFASQAAGGPLTITVRDEHGTGVPGQTVAFSVQEGGGTLAATTATSGAGGVVNVPTWTFGKSAVPQRIRATLGTLTVDVTGTVTSNYDIDVRFYGPAMTQQQQDAFIGAANRIRAIITGDVVAVAMTPQDGDCFDNGQILNETVDDVVIWASVAPRDGEGGVLASAGPCFVRSTNDLPIVGMMQFDSADLEEITALGLLQDVIMHEMLHVIGIGSIWEDKGLLVGAGTNDPRYTGAQARAACQSLGGASVCATSVPVANVGGAGSADSHWRESTFNSELMTSDAENGAMPLSRITIGALGDLGYTVNTAPFDTYAIGMALRAPGGRPPRRNWETPPSGPVKRIDPSGRANAMRIPQ